MFDKIYRILVMQKDAEAEPEAIKESLKPILGRNKGLKDLAFQLEMILEMERE